MLIKKYLIIIILFFSPLFIHRLSSQNADPPFLKYLDHFWVDSVLNSLTTDERIAQCIWIAGYSDRDTTHENEVIQKIKKNGIGGIIFFQGSAEKEADLTNVYQSVSKVPLLISMDAEWGTGMRLQNAEKFPYQMTLGAIRDDSLIYKMGKTIASHCRMLGIHLNLAPVADINNNPLNPVINYRSFGENRLNVTAKTGMYMKGLQDNGVMATLKHFPGHGDTNTDSHLDLPVILHNRNRLDSIELYPFKSLISEGAGCIMTAHLNLPMIDPTSGLPSTLSPVIIKDLLIRDLRFRGLVITDAMNMQGVTKYFKIGEAEALAFLAGNDIIEFVTDVDAAIREISNLIGQKKITTTEIDLKCRKILALKYWAGLDKPVRISEKGLSEELSSPRVKAQIRELYANSLTVLNNEGNILPVRKLGEIRIAAVAINRKKATLFQKRILDYHPADTFFIDPSDRKGSAEMIRKLAGYDLVIAGIFGTDQRSAMQFGIKPGLDDFLSALADSTSTIVTYFGNPYALAKLESLQKAGGLVLAYQENEYTEDLAAQLIFGGIGGHGMLPVTINEKWKEGAGIITPGKIRLQYGLPEEAGLSSEILHNRIDSIVFKGLEAGASPGCEVLIARDGIVIFAETYGFHTYEKILPVKKNDLYDLASLTKITATTAGLMLLDAEGKFFPGKKLGEYLPEFRHTNKGNLSMKEIMTHQAGFTAWIPFWMKSAGRDSLLKKRFYRNHYSLKYPVRVADSLYLNRNFRKKILASIKRSPLGEKKYLYSDLGFIIAPGIIESLSGEKWDDYVIRNIYHRLGAFDIGFNPVDKYPPDRIIPTEYDSIFRKQLLHGVVHDEGAAMLGGVSGHAGIFSTGNDLMKLMELYRRMGEYGGEQIISEEVMRRYTSVQFPENDNRRGLGFDKPLLNNSGFAAKEAYPASGATPESFGHSGFTGTFVWVDPVYKISYIFLSNRVYPTRNNNLLSEMNIRTDILQAVYDSIKN